MKKRTVSIIHELIQNKNTCTNVLVFWCLISLILEALTE